ncbi:peptidoglycan DD-metalloendopeptidase family protein [Candidatus Uhrbacteria bacterium]|nr:peptidoglycan DD-metalloendopeptidase family protein [Candidatus Uhrbacteria bacterium]
MRSVSLLSAIVVTTLLASGSVFALAQQAPEYTTQIDAINKSINEKKGNIDKINQQIEQYQTKIQEKQKEKATLNGELELLENRIAKSKLEIDQSKDEIDLINTQIALLNEEIGQLDQKLTHDKELMAGVLRHIQTKDKDLPLQLLFGSDSIADLFDEAAALQNVNEELKDTLESANQAKAQIETKRTNQQEQKTQQEKVQLALEKQQDLLEDEVGSRQTLIDQTQRSENAFRSLLQDLKQEQAAINQQIQSLQQEVERKLKSKTGTEAGEGPLAWPFDPSIKGLSTYFHDPTYPFRHLFEHSGIDLPAPTGTPVHAAASGYVAWARRGTQYGNYVMIIHADQTATLYAHLSRIGVSADQYVAQGDVIGAVGSTGFSTGPHLHFEVRKNGIPTNPLDYLPSF